MAKLTLEHSPERNQQVGVNGHLAVITRGASPIWPRLQSGYISYQQEWYHGSVFFRLLAAMPGDDFFVSAPWKTKAEERLL
jgi:hypothetical protein